MLTLRIDRTWIQVEEKAYSRGARRQLIVLAHDAPWPISSAWAEEQEEDGPCVPSCSSSSPTSSPSSSSASSSCHWNRHHRDHHQTNKWDHQGVGIIRGRLMIVKTVFRTISTSPTPTHPHTHPRPHKFICVFRLFERLWVCFVSSDIVHISNYYCNVVMFVCLDWFWVCFVSIVT